VDDPSGNDPRVLLAAERTFLAWIRTGVALMGFGFVVARFGIFLRELRPLDPRPGHALSVPIGIVLIAIGVLVTGAAAIRHGRYVRALREGVFVVRFRSGFPSLVAGLLVLLGALMAAYLARV
jgi:putative membrane protein